MREQAAQFLARYQDDAPCSHPALTVLARLTAAIQRLQSNVSALSTIHKLNNLLLIKVLNIGCFINIYAIALSLNSFMYK